MVIKNPVTCSRCVNTSWTKCYLSTALLGKENKTSLLLASVNSRAVFTADSISEAFQSPSIMCFILLKFTSFLLCAFSTRSGFNLISDESYASQKSPGDLKEKNDKIAIDTIDTTAICKGIYEVIRCIVIGAVQFNLALIWFCIATLSQPIRSKTNRGLLTPVFPAPVTRICFEFNMQY